MRAFWRLPPTGANLNVLSLRYVFLVRAQDSRTEYTQQNIKIVAQSDELLQFVTGLKVITNGNGEEELWLLTNRFQVLTDAPCGAARKWAAPVCEASLIVGLCHCVFAESDDGHDVDGRAQFPHICGADP